jgi:enoyl-CoA hydratase/carnithine racemase
MGSSYFLPRIVGWGRAAEMCLTGDRVAAQDAYRIGLANHVYSREDLFGAAMSMATNMCTKNRLGLRLTKDALNATLNGSSLEDANRMEDRNRRSSSRTGSPGGSSPWASSASMTVII